MRTLLLTSPAMKGPDVRAVQGRLGVTVDGEFGRKTADAVKAWRWRTGFPRALPGLGPWGQNVLLGKIPLPADYRARAAARAAATPAKPVRVLAVEKMESWADSGYVERPSSSNVVPELSRLATTLGLADWYARMGWPWCAFSAFLAAKAFRGVAATAGFAGKFNVLYCPAILAEATAGRNGLSITKTPARGDLAVLNFDGGVVDHIVRLREPPSGGFVATVEGNTSSGTSGSQNNGGGVYRRVRPLSLVSAFIRDN